MYDPQLILPCVQYRDTTVVGLAIKILSRKHMGLTQFQFEFQRFPKREKPMRMIMNVIFLCCLKAMPLFWGGAMTNAAYKL